MAIINLDEITLASGSHSSPEAGMCLMEAVAFFAEEPHSDRPQCACPVLTSFGIALNDSLTNESRQKLKPLIPRLIGTRNPELEQKRMYFLLDKAVRVFTPMALRSAAAALSAAKLADEAMKLSAEAEKLESLPEVNSESAARSAESAARSAARSAAWSAAWSAAESAESAAKSAWSAWSAARSAAWSARSAESAARSAVYDKAIEIFGEAIAIGSQPEGGAQ